MIITKEKMSKRDGTTYMRRIYEVDVSYRIDAEGKVWRTDVGYGSLDVLQEVHEVKG